MIYVNKVNSMLKLLYLAIHIMSGLPLRATEISPLQVSNKLVGTQIVKRHIFLEKQEKSFKIKSFYSKTGRKITTHHLFGDLAYVFAVYMALLKPTYAMLNYHHKNGFAKPSDDRQTYNTLKAQYFERNNIEYYLYIDVHGNHYSAEKLRSVFTTLFTKYYKCRFTIALYRHVSKIINYYFNFIIITCVS